MKKIIECIHAYKDTFFYNFLFWELRMTRKILDVGCGSSSPLGRIKNNSYKVGIDIFSPSLLKSRKNKIHNKYIKGDILHLSNLFNKGSFDAVVAFDVIEHFTKKDGLKIIRDMESIAKKKIIIFTPNGFLKQNMFENNSYQVHKSGWSVKDFQRKGYKVYGFRGIKFLRGEFASIKYKPWFLWGLVALISEPLLFYFPKLSFHLLAVKTIDE